MNCKKRAFTLIELLVVISIIALLVSILLPALSSAREQARMAVCSVHLSGVGKAVVLYTVDSKDRLPTQGLDNQGQPTVPYLDNQSISNYYTYWEEPFYGPLRAGPAEFGCLYLTGLLESDSNVVFCPSFRGSSMGGYNGQRHNYSGIEYDAWNAHGNVKHWNYCGVDAFDTTYRMRAEDEAKIGWLNSRVSYGFRPMFNLGIRSAAKASNMSYISDVWCATPSNGSHYRINIAEVSHAAKDASQAKMHVCYLDGHVERKSFDRDKYFVSSSSISGYPDGFTNVFPVITWSVLFEKEPYDYTLAR